MMFYVALMMNFLNFQDCEIPNPGNHCLKSFLGSQGSYFREKERFFKSTMSIFQTSLWDVKRYLINKIYLISIIQDVS